MELNAENTVLAPWYIHPPHMVCGRYLHSMLPGPSAYINNLVSLSCDHRPSLFDDIRVQSGIVKPKAIRISNLRPFINPVYPEHHATFASDFEEFRDRYDNTGFNLSCLPQSRHGLITQPHALYSSFPYVFSCLSSFQHQHSTSTLEAENIFKEMLRGQIPFFHCKKTSYNKGNDEKTCDISTDAAGASDLRLSLQSDYLKKSDHHWPSGRTSSTEASLKRLQVPFQLYTKHPCINSKVQVPKRHQICVQKLKQKALNNYRKHFMAPFTSTIKKEVIKKKMSGSLKANIIPTSSDKMKNRRYNFEALSLIGSGLNADASAESPTNTQKNIQESDLLSLHRPKYERREDDSVACETQSPKANESSPVPNAAVYHSPQACVVEEKKTFKCAQCRYLTDRKNNLKRHIMTMHQDSSKSLECCGISFQNKAALRDHNSIFHRGGYRCQICSRNFCRKALLRRHLTVHSGQKDFFCDICGYATSHKSNLERHQKVHTKREPTIGGIRKTGSAKRGLRLGSANFLTHTILNSRVQCSRYEEAGLTSPVSKYGTTSKSLEAGSAMQQKAPYAVFIKETPDNYQDKLRMVPSLRNTVHNYTNSNSHHTDDYDCDNMNINITREDTERPVTSLQLHTY